jgi:NADH-quinone oxidoreductase subunit L
MFFGWEGVGLASYLLIGFWYEKPSARKAAMKAFWVNRVGDFGFLLGIFACYQMMGALDFTTLFKNASQLIDHKIQFGDSSCNALTLICLLFFMGAMGKSAQLGLHTWLPDAMEGPTPVSALIHAATMVTAGVFMVARLSPLFELAPTALAVVACVGAATAFIAATIGMTQYDIKRVIAYSTMSQLGYMFFAAGVSAYGAAIFHLATHAFFKALLFLAAGSVIHAMSGEQDMRKMGGLWRKIPYTYALMWIGSLSLAGVGIEGLFGFAGAYSKDMILEAAYAHGTWYGTLAFALGLMSAFMTAFYSWRLIVLTFHGQARGKEQVQAHESPVIMLGPLVPLALGAIFAGFVGHEWFASAANGFFWQNAIFVKDASAETAHHVPWLIRSLPLLMALAGMGLAIKLYLQRPYIILSIVQRLGLLYKLVANKYYFDEIYDRLFVRSLPRLGSFLWHRVDDGLIDRFGPDGVAVAVQNAGERLRRVQTGYLYHYAFAMLAGVTLLVLWPFAVRLYGFFWGGVV